MKVRYALAVVFHKPSLWFIPALCENEAMAYDGDLAAQLAVSPSCPADSDWNAGLTSGSSVVEIERLVGR